MLSNRLNNWFKSSIRVVLTVVVCGLLFISNTFVAQANTNTSSPTASRQSDPREGEVSLNKIQAKTDAVAKSNPRGIEEITKEAQKGLNAVQGGADKDKMISPQDAQGATTIEEQADNLLDKIGR